MMISSSVAEWQAWTGLAFAVCGPYIVEGALAPIQIDLAGDRGIYHDPNVWVVHSLPRTPDTGAPFSVGTA
ncbi:MAG: hypothetical protein ACLQBX_06665 [Candidatus Limnocylindrales bacterium]